MNKLKLESIISSIVIYLILIITVFYGAFYEPSIPKAKNYTAKKSEIIEVSLGSPHRATTNTKKVKKKTAKKKHTKKHVKKVRNVKKVTKKVVKKRVKKAKKQTKKVTKKTLPKAASLFKNLPKGIKEDKIKSNQPKGNSGKSLKKVNKSSGVKNAYFAKIQNTLRGWPAQSNFAGEKIRVELTVYPSGLFDYKILYHSLNPEFNRALKTYLEQLKKFGFGPHSNPKPYHIIVEFIAKG